MDFLVPVYPVISMTEPWLHRGSRNNLLGEPADPAEALALSSEKQVTPRTPPAFLVHSSDDTGVPVENRLAFYAALRRAAAPAELHVFQKGGTATGWAGPRTAWTPGPAYAKPGCVVGVCCPPGRRPSVRDRL